MPALPRIVILTGAGVSAESGINTFRGAGGLWEGHQIEDVASPEGYARNPSLVHEFYNQRRAQLHHVAPNAAHTALAELEKACGEEFLLVTQNVDDLHERAGSRNLIHMHGQLRQAWCLLCQGRFPWLADLGAHSQCPRCGKSGKIRPDIVWFGEIPYQMDAIQAALSRCELFISIGTSGKVYPAAGFVTWARQIGAYTVEVNFEPTDVSGAFHSQRVGPASSAVPALVSDILAGNWKM